MKINTNYIEDLKYRSSDDLKPVRGSDFLTALTNKYGIQVMKEVGDRFYNQTLNTNSPYQKGSTQFFERYISYASGNGTIPGADQKYIADYAENVFSNLK